ncbi:eukaryotic translation initiation factor 3 subunit E, partial [Aromatoleum aromaticum]|uniref:eukaryotic translation initiation factor 3 subunit E n=1 Tax=Aromatoleum aromaticum TaxID=551760 RepID=UPI002006EBF9
RDRSFRRPPKSVTIKSESAVTIPETPVTPFSDSAVTLGRNPHSEYNAKLEAILKGNVSDAAMADVHQLTYTLENALGKMNEELTELAETLEKLHQASEKLDRENVIQHGDEYLSVSRQLVK